MPHPYDVPASEPSYLFLALRNALSPLPPPPLLLLLLFFSLHPGFPPALVDCSTLGHHLSSATDSYIQFRFMHKSTTLRTNDFSEFII